MSALRRGIFAASGLACRVAGRYRVVQGAQVVLDRARLDVPSYQVDSGGELSLQRWVLDAAPYGPIQVIDVGANRGQWSEALIAAARSVGRYGDVDLHVFEPSAYTFGQLERRLAGRQAKLNQVAVSDRAGRSVLHVVGPGAETNSLYRAHDTPEGTSTETVAVTTLDEYASAARLQRVTLLKADTEGNDMAVLRGARGLFAAQRVSVVQFEYNRWWVYARCYLRDAFDFFQPLGYKIGKLTPWGVEFYSGWHSELETFIQGNYVAAAPDAAGWVPAIQWWRANPSRGRRRRGSRRR
jgi:FkbM family methyltransferase